MALQVWLPLNGNLNNQGLNSITVTDGGATVNNNGKIGKCYYFDGTDDYINLGNLNNYFDGSPFTICFWIKSLENATRGVIFSSYALPSGSNFFCIEVNSNSVTNNSLRFDWNGSPDTHAAAGSIPYNEWAHIAVVYNGTNATQIYKNGSLINTLTMTLTSLSSTNNFYLGRDSRTGTTAFNGYLNDFRIYDHALSPKEIEILSRGLVCHYPLNNAGNGQKNYLKNSNFLQGTNGMEGYTATGATCTKQTDCMKVVSGGASSGFFTSNFDSITTGDMTTFSAWVKADSSMTIYIGTDGSGNGSCQAYTIGTNWQKISISKEKTTNNANLRIYGQGTFYVRHMKYELGSTATPWMPNPADTAYTAMGYNSTTEYDVSGYGYNMDSHGSITYSSDSPRYSVCPYYQNTDMYLSATSPTSTIRTISFWVKYTSAISSYRVAFGDYKSHLAFGMINSTSACVTCGGQSKDTFTITAPTANKWYHIVVKRASDSDSADVELYINGIKQTTRGTADSWNHNSDTLMIGRRATGSSVVGYMSDFRAYVTPLTEVQIKELYNTAVSVANNGTLMGYELVEV